MAKTFSTTGVNFIKWKLKFHKIKYEKEFLPIKGRKFRADFYLPDFNTIIEFEGLNSAKSGHTTLLGYTKNCEKYNLISLQGYTLLRFTIKNLHQVEPLLIELIKRYEK